MAVRKGVAVRRQDDRQLLVIGSFLFRHCIQGHVARQVSRGELKAKRDRFSCSTVVRHVSNMEGAQDSKLECPSQLKCESDMFEMTVCQFEPHAL